MMLVVIISATTTHAPPAKAVEHVHHAAPEKPIAGGKFTTVSYQSTFKAHNKISASH